MPPQQKLIIEIDEERAKRAVETAFLSLTGFPLKEFRHKAERRLARERGYGMAGAGFATFAVWMALSVTGIMRPNPGLCLGVATAGLWRVWRNR